MGFSKEHTHNYKKHWVLVLLTTKMSSGGITEVDYNKNKLFFDFLAGFSVKEHNKKHVWYIPISSFFDVEVFNKWIILYN